jgi:hypothetical protein
MAPAPTLSSTDSTSHRLAATVAGTGDHAGHFKKMVGNTKEAISSAKARYVLAPDVTEQAFLAFIDEVRGIVGQDNVYVNVSDSSKGLQTGTYLEQPRYTDFFPINDPEKYMASAAIQPATSEEVQRVVKAANTHGQPIHTVSIGRNLGYGGTSPRLRGTAILDLKRMNRILEVNETSGYALLEPGVSYFELFEHLQKIGSNLWIDCPDIGWGSVVGNTCERGAGYTPYGDHFMFHCGMEVVLASGEIVRTGMGALPNNDTWQCFNYGFGPYHDGIFTQSNFGVVTKMGVWLMPNPQGYRPFLITVPNKADLKPMMDIIGQLRLNMVIQNAPTIRHVLLDAACLKTRAQWTGRPDDHTPLTEEETTKIANDLNLGYWGFYGALYGPQPVRDVLWGAIWGALSQIPGSKHFFEEDVGAESLLHSRAKTLSGTPNLLELDWISWREDGAHNFFSPISAATGDAAMKQVELVERICKKHGFDFMNTLVIGLRELHNINCLVYNRNSVEDRRRMRECIYECIEEAAKEGWGEYRTHNEFMDAVAGTYNWNDNALSKLNETLKDALDPNGILAPGKNGVWGKRFRGRGF